MVHQRWIFLQVKHSSTTSKGKMGSQRTSSGDRATSSGLKTIKNSVAASLVTTKKLAACNV